MATLKPKLPANAKLNASLIAQICERAALGDPLPLIAKHLNFSRYKFYQRLLSDSVVANMYTRAKELCADTMADEIIALRDKATPENAHAIRVKIDARRWIAGKLKPKVYGDRPSDVNVGVTNNVVVLTEEKARELQARLKELRALKGNDTAAG